MDRASHYRYQADHARRQLRDDELVSIEEHIVIIKDVEALSAFADFERSYLDQFRLPGLIAKY